MTPWQQLLNSAIYVQTLAAFIWLGVIVLLERFRGARMAELRGMVKTVRLSERVAEDHLAAAMQLWRRLEKLDHDTDVPPVSERLWETARPGSSEETEKTDPGFRLSEASDHPGSALPAVRKTPSGVMVSSRWHCTGCLRTFELTQFAHGKRCGWCGGSLEALPDVREADASS
jgi:hypothetical protein